MKHKRFSTLKEWRAAHGYSQSQAGALIGVTQAAYGRYEMGRAHPRPAILRRVMKLTGVPVEVLAGVA